MAQRKHVQGMSEGRERTDGIALERLRDRLRAFASARDWNQFHSPKNLAIALSVEAGELPKSMAASGISDKAGIMALLSSHPPIEARIAALQSRR